MELDEIRRAQAIFTGIARGYDGPAQVFGLFRYRSWHRALVDAVAARKPRRVLDMCTGTGALAAAIRARTGAEVVAVDVTRAMLEQARRRTDMAGVHLVHAAAQAPPFAPGSFDAVVFSYLLRYVGDVPATLGALAALVRPGGFFGSIEFGLPEHPVARAAWQVYTGVVLRAGLALLSPGWRRVGGFLGPSIRDFHTRHPVPALENEIANLGFVCHPTRRLSLGGGVLMTATRLPVS